MSHVLTNFLLCCHGPFECALLAVLRSPMPQPVVMELVVRPVLHWRLQHEQTRWGECTFK